MILLETTDLPAPPDTYDLETVAAWALIVGVIVFVGTLGAFKFKGRKADKAVVTVVVADAEETKGDGNA